jgi:hypothetical protein
MNRAPSDSALAVGKRWRRLAVLLPLTLAGAAFAQSKVQERVVQEADRTVFRKKTVIDFTDMAVEGELTKPEGSYVMDRNKARFRSLVRVRDNFAPELQKSVDNL